jgi:hypothetical protein
LGRVGKIAVEKEVSNLLVRGIICKVVDIVAPIREFARDAIY